jgi:hypothetical protein
MLAIPRPLDYRILVDIVIIRREVTLSVGSVRRSCNADELSDSVHWSMLSDLVVDT